MKKPNNRMHSDKINLRRFALQLYFSGDARRYAVIPSPNPVDTRHVTRYTMLHDQNIRG